MQGNIRNLKEEVLSNDWYTLKKYHFDFRNRKGEWITQSREAYNRGNGATIILYDRERNTVILTRQFRLPTYVNGNADGMLIEACAGLLDELSPEECIRKELLEETGYAVTDITPIFQSYMSPGSVTEILHFYVGFYQPKDRVAIGGGVAKEQEEIETFECTLMEAEAMIGNGKIKDAKTIMLIQYLLLFYA